MDNFVKYNCECTGHNFERGAEGEGAESWTDHACVRRLLLFIVNRADEKLRTQDNDEMEIVRPFWHGQRLAAKEVLLLIGPEKESPEP